MEGGHLQKFTYYNIKKSRTRAKILHALRKCVDGEVFFTNFMKYAFGIG